MSDRHVRSILSFGPDPDYNLIGMWGDSDGLLGDAILRRLGSQSSHGPLYFGPPSADVQSSMLPVLASPCGELTHFRRDLASATITIELCLDVSH